MHSQFLRIYSPIPGISYFRGPVHHESRGNPGAHVHSHDRAFSVGSSLIISISSQRTDANKQIPVLFSCAVVSSPFDKSPYSISRDALLADTTFQASNLRRFF
jgi:hypothetical protein